MNSPQKIDLGPLHDAMDRLERMFPSERPVTPAEEMQKRYGTVAANIRNGGLLVAGIISSPLTLNEMGLILEAITDRVCRCIRDYGELEETAHDLALTCEEFDEALKKIDDRLYRQSVECDGRT